VKGPSWRTARESTCDRLRMTRRTYRLTIEGELGEIARGAFEGATVTVESGNTIVVVRDQAELFGLVQRISDLGLTLVSATPADERTHPVP
jgi:hypothetical protein